MLLLPLGILACATGGPEEPARNDEALDEHREVGSGDAIAAPRFIDLVDSLATLVRVPAEREETFSLPVPAAGGVSGRYSRARAHPLLAVVRPHDGVDIRAPRGSTIVAPAEGRAVRVQRLPEYGLLLEVAHGDDVVTRYAHCAEVLIKAGERVRRGQPIARVGSSGLSTGPHLHYEIRVAGTPVDPLTFRFRSAREE